MTNLNWKNSKALTLGVEVELQIIDSKTYDLYPASIEIVGELNSPQVQPEIFQSMVELNTSICDNADQVREQFYELFTKVLTVANRRNLLISGAGSHPFAQHTDRKLYPNPRYDALIKRNKWIARRLQIFGTHVHIGCTDGNQAINLMNHLIPWLPVFLALSSSSPFMYGEWTELKTSRITLFEAMPTSGHPSLVGSWKEFDALYTAMLGAGAIESHKDLWWDIRPSPGYGTIEVRICDGLASLQELWALVAFIHLVATSQSHGGDLQPHDPSSAWIVRENKWRAALHGVKAELIWRDGEKVSVSDLIDRFLSRYADIVDQFGYRNAMDQIKSIVSNGSSADRQVRAFEADGNLKSVVQCQIDDFRRFHP